MKKLGHYEGASQRIGTLRTALKEGKWDSCKKLLNAIYALLLLPSQTVTELL